MKFLRFITSRIFLKNLAYVFLLLIVLSSAVYFGLNLYTLHNKQIQVPQYVGLSIDSVETLCKEQKLRIQIIDSAYVNGLPGGTVIEHHPDSGSMVKKDRTIYCTINAYEAEKLPMPNLIDLSFRKARSVILNKGFQIGHISMRPDIAQNIVLDQLIDDTIVEPGTLVKKGSVIDLVLGQGLSDQKINVPDIVSFTLDSAKNYLNGMYLNIGALILDDELSDTTELNKTLIYRQMPESDEYSQIKLGSAIDVWLTLDSTKLPLDTINQAKLDSLLNE